VPTGVALVAAVASLALGGCGSLFVPDPSAIATTISSAPTANGMAWTVGPWPLGGTRAWLCFEEPPAIGIDVTPDPGTCAPLAVDVADGTLTAAFDSAAAPAVTAGLRRTSPPWFLVLAGRGGLGSFSTVVEVVESPLPGDARHG
jgi:hypothetical protein